MVDGEMLKVRLRVVTEDFLQTLIYGQVSAVHYHGNTGAICTPMVSQACLFTCAKMWERFAHG
jgi:hypothetical protein